MLCKNFQYIVTNYNYVDNKIFFTYIINVLDAFELTREATLGPNCYS